MEFKYIALVPNELECYLVTLMINVQQDTHTHIHTEDGVV